VPLAGIADAPDVPASPMPATVKPAIKILRIIISLKHCLSSIAIAPKAFLLTHSFYADLVITRI
jgi:hypothetical protein